MESRKRLIIPIFIPHQGCPHRCVFCNQEMITNWEAVTPSVNQIQGRIRSFLRTFEGCSHRREVAFYGGSFTALPLWDQKALLKVLQPFIDQDSIDAIRVSTRPDAIDENRLNVLRNFKVETVEVGAQSLVDEILRNCHRGHTSRDVIQSVQLVRSKGLEVGVQIMLGLPGEDMKLFVTTVRRVIDLAPDFVRIYPLLVLKGSPLEKLYREGLYTPISLKDAVHWAKVALGLLDQAQIPVIRMGLQPTADLQASQTLLAGPFHPAFRSLVESSIFYDMACSLLEELGKKNGPTVRFRIGPCDLSNLKGERKENLARLKKTYGLECIEIFPDPEVPRGKLVLESPRGPLAMSKGELKGSQTARA